MIAQVVSGIKAFRSTMGRCVRFAVPLVLAAMVWSAAVESAGTPTSTAGRTYRIVAYARTWSAAQTPDVSKINNLIFSFARVRRGRAVISKDGMDRLRMMLALKDIDPALAVDISLGGASEKGFPAAVATERGRRILIRSAVRLVTENGADGLDVDWEFPGFAGPGVMAVPAQRKNFTELIKGLRIALNHASVEQNRQGDRRYTLTIAIAGGPFDYGEDLTRVSEYVDWLNVMTYSFCGTGYARTCHQSALYPAMRSIPYARITSRTVKQLLGLGVPAGKIMLGIPFYAKEFHGVEKKDDGLYEPFLGSVTTIDWPDLRSNYINKNGFVRYWDATSQVPWLWNAVEAEFITYDDPMSIAIKAAYVKQLHLGGMMYWEQSLDTTDELLDAMWGALH